MSEPVSIQNVRAARLFEAYVAAATRAQVTHDMDDGLAAGRAWAAFLDVFVAPELRIGARRIPFQPGVPHGVTQ